MALPKLPSQPPLSVDFQSILHSSKPGAEPKQHDWKMHRASDGKMRYDHGNHSVITDPSKQQVTLLDHVKKEAHVLPMPAHQAPAGPPGASPHPGSSAPAGTPLNVKDLGKRMIAGHEAEGKSYTLPAPKPSVTPPSATPPKPTQASAPPPAPGAPPSVAPPKPSQGAAPPPAPATPPPPQVSPPKAPGLQTVEVWTSHKLQLPLASSVTGASGKSSTIGKQVTTGEPHPSMFQIPADYKLVPPPKAPTSSH